MSPKKKKSKKAKTKKKKKAQTEQGPEITPAPTAGPRVETFEQILDEQLNPEQAPPETTGRPRGRPSKAPGQPAQPEQVPNEIIKQAIQVPFDMWALSQNIVTLKLSDKEAALLTNPIKALLDYYAPTLPAISIAWLSLATAAYAVMKPRFIMIARIKKTAAETAQGSQDRKPPPAAAEVQEGIKITYPTDVKPTVI